MTTEEQEKFEKILAKGKKRFVIRNGVLFWGGLMALIYTFINPIINFYINGSKCCEACNCSIGVYYWNYLFSKTFFLNLGIAVIIFGITGYLVGLSMWKTLNKNYKI